MSNNLQRLGGGAGALWRATPVAGRVVVVIVGGLTLLYLWQILLGLFFLAALGVGIVTIIKWFVAH